MRDREELLRSIIEHVPVPIMVSREDRKILLINPALTEFTGYTAADIPTRDEWEALAYRDLAPWVKEQVGIAFEKAIPTDRGELRIYTKFDQERLWSIKTAPSGRDASGQRLTVTVGLDITERKKSDEEALATKSKLEAALAAMRDGVFILDAESRFIDFNDAFATVPQIQIERGLRSDIFRVSGYFKVVPTKRRTGAAGGMAFPKSAPR